MLSPEMLAKYRPFRHSELVRLVGNAVACRDFGTSEEVYLIVGVSLSKCGVSLDSPEEEPIAILANGCRVSATQLLTEYSLLYIKNPGDFTAYCRTTAGKLKKQEQTEKSCQLQPLVRKSI